MLDQPPPKRRAFKSPVVLEAMGFDLGAIHAVSDEQTTAIHGNLDGLTVGWLNRAAKVEDYSSAVLSLDQILPSSIRTTRIIKISPITPTPPCP